MDHTYLETKNLKTLEDYAVFLASAIISLRTLHNMQVRALEIGILTDDMAERGNTCLWDFKRLIKQHVDQITEVLQLLPDDFTEKQMMNSLNKAEIKTKSRKKKEVSSS